MKYYLVTTGISEIWDPESKLLLLGPWCLIDKRNKEILKDRDYCFVPSPWKPVYRIKEAADYCYNVYEGLLPKLSDAMNYIHNVKYSTKYWRVLTSCWLLDFIGVLYDRYERIEKTIKLFSNFYTNVLPGTQCKLATYDTSDFLHNKVIDSDYYNLKLFSLVIDYLCPEKIIEQNLCLEPKSKHRNIVFKYNLKRKMFYNLLGLLDVFFKNSIVLSPLGHLSPKDVVLLKWKIGFKTLSFKEFEPIPKRKLLKNDYSQELRKGLVFKGGVDKFQSFLYKILPNAIPMSFMENYKIYRDSLDGTENIDYIKMVGSATGWFFNERLKFFGAELSAKGTLLAEFQHGGNYGVSLATPPETMALEKDIFYTWGWSLNESHKTRPFPNPHLSKLKNTYHLERYDKILFVGVTLPKYHYRFTTWLLPEDMPKYFEDKKIFIKLLSDEIRKKILYRPYFDDYGWNEKEFIQHICPDVELLLKGKLVKWMQKVRLVVIDHPHTSFLEALTINAPCIFYWDHDVYLMRPEAEEYFKLLRDAGILYKSPIGAAEKINEISLEPMSWWLNKKVQEARLKFCEHFAYARSDWMEIWAKEIRQIIRPRGEYG